MFCVFVICSLDFEALESGVSIYVYDMSVCIIRKEYCTRNAVYDLNTNMSYIYRRLCYYYIEIGYVYAHI